MAPKDLAVVPQMQGLAHNPNPPAAMAKKEELLSDGFISLAGVPFQDYWHFRKGNKIRGEVIASVQRFEENDEGETETRRNIILRITLPTECSKTVKNKVGSPPYVIRGKVEESATGKDRDVYNVPAGTLVGVDYKPVLMDVLLMAQGAEAYEVEIVCVGKFPHQDDPKRTVWRSGPWRPSPELHEGHESRPPQQAREAAA